MSELSPETKALLQKAKAPTPLARSHKARIKAVVLANLAAGTIAATSTTAAATSVFSSTQLLVAFGVGASIGVGAIVVHEVAAPQPRPQPAVSAAASSSPSVFLPAAEPSRPATATSCSAPVPVPDVVPRPKRLLRSDVEDDGALVPVPLPASSAPRTEVPGEAEPGPPSPQLALQEEVRLIREADRCIKTGDGVGALRALDEHARRFPSGALAPERGVQRVLALCAAGRVREARAQGAALMEAGGPLGARVRASCAGKP